MDLQEDKKVVKKFVKEYNLTFPVLLAKTGRVGGMYGRAVFRRPTLFT